MNSLLVSTGSWEFATAGKIIFGSGTILQLGQIIKQQFGPSCNILLIHGSDKTRVEKIEKTLLNSNLIISSTFSITKEPTTDTVSECIQHCQQGNKPIDCVIAIGGGSVLDLGKAVAALLSSGGNIFDYLEVIGKGLPIPKTLPFIAIPTTSGTGSEVTRNSVLLSVKDNVKVSMRSELLLPKIALIDPELTRTCPPSVIRSSGLDALTQNIEVFVCNKRNPITDSLSREGITRSIRSLCKVFHYSQTLQQTQTEEDPQIKIAREDLSISALFSGICLANAKLGLVHGIAGPLGGMINASHGAICAAALPFVVKFNIMELKKLNQTNPNDQFTKETLERFVEIAQIAHVNNAEVQNKHDTLSAESCFEWLLDLCKQKMKVPGLSELGLKREMIPQLVINVQRASSTKGNPVLPSSSQIEHIILESL